MLINGVNLGQMDALLLKKIEELSLYVIDLKRKRYDATGNSLIENNK